MPSTAAPGTDRSARERLVASSAADVYDALGTRPEGLTSDEAQARLAQTGPNVLREVRRPHVVRRLVANVTHLMALLLWLGGFLALAAGLPEFAVAVWVVNVLNGLFSFWQEYKAERAVEALRELLPVRARVLRDGRAEQVRAEQLVYGDVVLLEAGDGISADARLVEGMELRVDQSALTGESRPVARTARSIVGATSLAERRNLVHAGTTVSSGRGKAVVFATGMGTEFGRVAGLTQAMAVEPSPLQRELAWLSRVVGVIAVGMGALFFAIAVLLTPMESGRGLVFALGMIVAFVPEGLLPTVTLSLAMATQRMANRNALVKRLSSVEALGSTTIICTDKTGTLTENEMTVREVFLPSGAVTVGGVGYEPVGELRRGAATIATPASGDLGDLLRCGALANDARLVAPTETSTRWSVLGDPTEGALLVAARKAGIDHEAESASRPRVFEIPFDSARRRMSTIHRDGDRFVIRTKGAARELLSRCSHLRIEGRDEPLTDEWRARILRANDEYSRAALRVLAFAQRQLAGPPRHVDPEHAESDLVFLGLVAMMDPPRPEVADAISICRRAGIRVVMMTGDYGLTAESVARRVGLVEGPGVRIVNGDEIDSLDDAGLRAVLAGDVILARTTPAHKLRVVEVLQGLGHVVAVTGDGVNDAPALKKADIGVAMGVAGTDVAREAADMVLLDDNFASIVAAIEEGRTVYANIRKFTGYIFTSNTPEVVPFVLYGLSGGRIPIALDVMHILTIDLGTDIVPALALGAEAPEPGTMDRPPRRPNEHLVTAELLTRSYFWLGPLQAAAVMFAFYSRYWDAGYAGQWLDLPDEGALYASATAMALAAVVTTQIGNLFAHRTDRESVFRVGLFSNKVVWIGIASELAILLAIVYVPVFQDIVGTESFPASSWWLLFALSPLLLVVDEIRKSVRRWRVRRTGRHP